MKEEPPTMSLLRLAGGLPPLIPRIDFAVIPPPTAATNGHKINGHKVPQHESVALDVLTDNVTPQGTLHQALQELLTSFPDAVSRVKALLGIGSAAFGATPELPKQEILLFRQLQIRTGSESGSRQFTKRRITRYHFTWRVVFMMKQRWFKIRARKVADYYVILTPTDLGFEVKCGPDELLNEEYLSEWSEAHQGKLGGRFQIEPCHHDVATFLIGQYKNQPKGEVLWMAMEPVPDTASPQIAMTQLVVERDQRGWQEVSLGLIESGPKGKVPLERKYLFHLRKARKTSR